MFRRQSVVLLGLLFFAIVCKGVTAGEELRFDFHIQSLPLEQALVAFGRQINFEVVYSIPPSASTKRTPALVGRFTVDEALKRLLKDSGGEYRKVGSDMIVFKIAQPPSG